jgi:phosphatidylinositol alpha 1,6-mannosyltransferase
LRGGDNFLTVFPRIAFLPDTFYEVNGVAHTARHLEAFARRRSIPFLSIHSGPSTEFRGSENVSVLELKRGPASIGLDTNLDCDPFLFRYTHRVIEEVRKFGAEVVHITGPGDMGVLGSFVAWKLKLPMAISWHTSLHEYAARRLERLLGSLGEKASYGAGHIAEKLSMEVLRRFYRRAEVVLAPNHELVEMLKELTRRPVFLMQRGVDTNLFTPARRSRHDQTFRIGYVGRLTTEKNVRFLAELSSALRTLGRTGFEFMIVGQGKEEEWLRSNVENAVLTGVLRGENLAEAYANMDLFVFPSRTDTFGNAVLEALSSGVPAVVTNEGGPKFLVHSGVTGYVASSDWEFTRFVNGLMTNLDMHYRMREAARHFACGQTWDAVFENVFEAYRACLGPSPGEMRQSNALLSSRVHERRGP